MEIRSAEEIEKMLLSAIERINQPSQFSGMSYEQGVEAALRWVAGEADENPLEDE